MRRIATSLICVTTLAACGQGAEAARIDQSRGTVAPVIDLSHMSRWPPHEFLAAFDHAGGLKTSPSDAEPELRLWVAGMMETKGYIISTGRALDCHALYRNDGLKASVDSAHCAASFMSGETRHSILTLVGELSALNGKSWGCAFGGYTLFVEGFANHQRFSFLVSNPSLCKDADSQLVTRLVGALGS